MKKYFALSIFLLILLFVAFINIRYCCQCQFLKFDSNEFNNILTPIISLVGVVGLFATIYLSLIQIKYIRSDQYFKDYMQKIEAFPNGKDVESGFNNIQLLSFTEYTNDVYRNLKSNYPIYFDDVTRFERGEIIPNIDKPYEQLLANARLFRVQALMLYTRLNNLIKEIEKNKSLSSHHKDLLLDNLISGQLSKYIASCWLLEHEMGNIIKEFYLGFCYMDNNKPFKFFDLRFFDLRDYIFSKPELKKYYSNNARM